MPPKAPPPPQPDPLTLDQIYDGIVSVDSPTDSRAYNIVALNTVAFHPTVKLFFFEYYPDEEGATAERKAEIAAMNRARREALIKNVAFFLAIRNNPVSRECRWETTSLIGELCRMDQISTGPNTKSSPSNPTKVLEERLNQYAKANLEYLATLPWFRTTLTGIVEGEEPDKASATSGISSSNGKTSREEMKQKLKEQREKKKRGGAEDFADDWEETDEDVKIAMKDILRALPIAEKNPTDNTFQITWTPENLEQAHDLMFLDASTSLSHLIPMVSRCSSNACAKCMKKKPTDVVAGSTENSLLRCSACKAVFYCSPECQKSHWSTTHRLPCLAYKEISSNILAQYYALNSKKKKEAKKGEVTILEVPLEPSLFFETRRYLYDHRDSSFSNVNFSDYFLKYTVRGN